MSLTNAFDDVKYRALASDLLRTASDSIEVEVTDVEYVHGGYGDYYSWLCFIVDPRADDYVAPTTSSSAADHFALMNPNGFEKNAGSQVRVSVFEMQVSDEAAIFVRGEGGQKTLTSPWVAHLAVARVVFNYTLASI